MIWLIVHTYLIGSALRQTHQILDRSPAPWRQRAGARSLRQQTDSVNGAILL
jgi:hypothetical protein